MGAYYNEIDPYCAQWLRNLIDAGHIARGDVDERSVLDVYPADLVGYTQCHFFAGIGGWSYALRLAGSADDRPVWTGSCPCQPFSVAGRGDGVRDERHLWPFWHHLIAQCRPAVVFGEQVDAALRHGWLDLVCADLEGLGYAVGAADMPAAGVGAPHIRQRLYWVADAYGWNACAEGIQRSREHGQQQENGCVDGMDDTGGAGLEGHRGNQAAGGRDRTAGSVAAAGKSNRWRDIEWIACSDGKARATQPGIFPLAHGISGRVGRLRAYGNAIVPQVAAEFIRAYTECRP